jgi:hypothetical protein
MFDCHTDIICCLEQCKKILIVVTVDGALMHIKSWIDVTNSFLLNFNLNF